MSRQHSGTSQTTTAKHKQLSKIRAQSHKTVIDPLKRDLHWEKKALLESAVSSFCVENILVFNSCLPQKKLLPSDLFFAEEIRNKE